MARKYKVVLDRLTPVKENGSRDFADRTILCTCCDQGTAQLIRSRLSEPYKVLTEKKSPNSPMYILTVTQ